MPLLQIAAKQKLHVPVCSQKKRADKTCRADLEQLLLTRGQQALLWLTLEVCPVCSGYSIARRFDLPLGRDFPTVVHEHHHDLQHDPIRSCLQVCGQTCIRDRLLLSVTQEKLVESKILFNQNSIWICFICGQNLMLERKCQTKASAGDFPCFGFLLQYQTCLHEGRPTSISD